MMRTLALTLSILFAPALLAGDGTAAKPNVLIIYYDDMGWGDMGANTLSNFEVPTDSKYLQPSARSLTPHLDRFSEQSMRFTNGHSADGVCTPSRYALMTGRYCWRTSRKRGVTGGYSPSLMQVDEFTVGKMFQSLGYTTAMVGKWHVGMQFYGPDGKPCENNLGNNPNVLANNKIDFSKPVTDTPHHTSGFDYYFGTSASLDMPPYAWLETRDGQVNVLLKGGVVQGETVDFSQAEIATNDKLEERKGIKQAINAFARDGVIDPAFVFEDYLQIQAQKTVDLIEQYEAGDQPFFIYVPMPSPHTPHSVQDKFKGSAGWKYGDFVVQTDHYTGQIIDALGDPNNPNSLAAKTVVFITSDNGPENGAHISSQEFEHDANGPWAGRKRDSYEGGTRVPFLVRWPGKMTPGSTTDHSCWQGDFIATMAEHLGYQLGPKEAPDAESFLPVLTGQSMPTARRQAIIQHSSSGQFAIVDYTGEWKLIDGTGGGGNKLTSDADNNESLPKGDIRGTPRQLFNLKKDPGERNNLLTHPTPESLAIADELYELLNQIRGDKQWGTNGSSFVPR